MYYVKVIMLTCLSDFIFKSPDNDSMIQTIINNNMVKLGTAIISVIAIQYQWLLAKKTNLQ